MLFYSLNNISRKKVFIFHKKKRLPLKKRLIFNFHFSLERRNVATAAEKIGRTAAERGLAT